MISLRKNNSFSWKDVLSYRNELYGLAIFWIVLFHIYCNVGFVGKSILPSKVYTAISLIMIRGNLGVDVFLFLSAIGLSRSIRNNDIKTFYHHRWNRVFLPYLLLAVLFSFGTILSLITMVLFNML